MNDASTGPRGWTFLRVLGFILGLLMLAGFGFFSLCGLVVAGPYLGDIIWLVLGSSALAAAGLWLMLRMGRLARRKD